MLNYGYEVTRAMGERAKSKVYWFSRSVLPIESRGVFIRDGNIILRLESNEENIMREADVALKGTHNLENALAAALCAKLAGCPSDKISGVLRTFDRIEDRQEIVRELNGVIYVNDTTATVPAAAIAALERFATPKPRVILIAGGNPKNISYGEMAKLIRGTCKYVLLLKGNASDELYSLIGANVSVFRVDSMAQAVSAASRVAESGDVVLLSPGATSFASFKNEFDRGDQFKKAVTELK